MNQRLVQLGPMIRKIVMPLALVSLAAPALAAPAVQPDSQGVSLHEQVAAVLAAGPKGVRFGLLVTDEDGREIVAVNPDQRFIPASTTKLFTTATAYALLTGMDQPDQAGGAQAWLEPDQHRKSAANVVIYGRGDARMSSAADCKVNCLATLADAVAGVTRMVHDVIGDDTLWPDQRWVPGMSWNNIGTDSGTAVSALNLDDNELRIAVSAGLLDQAPVVQIPPYFGLRNEAVTAAPGSKTQLFVERTVNGTDLRLYGTIAADAPPWSDRLGIDDPAHYAAWTLRSMLMARGVKVSGQVRVRHRPQGLADQPESGAGLPGVVPTTRPSPLASLVPPPLSEDVVTINKVSQNLHAQALFRRIGAPALSEQWSSAVQRKVLEQAGVPPTGFEFSDGSGMSTYNRISPRAAVTLLRWAKSQPWGVEWLASLPIAGRDGTLKRRFVGTALEGNLAAKTGTLNATNALAGSFVARSGRRLYFAFYANDVPAGTSAIQTMETVLLRIAAN